MEWKYSIQLDGGQVGVGPFSTPMPPGTVPPVEVVVRAQGRTGWVYMAQPITDQHRQAIQTAAERAMAGWPAPETTS